MDDSWRNGVGGTMDVVQIPIGRSVMWFIVIGCDVTVVDTTINMIDVRRRRNVVFRAPAAQNLSESSAVVNYTFSIDISVFSNCNNEQNPGTNSTIGVKLAAIMQLADVRLTPSVLHLPLEIVYHTFI